MSAKQIIPTVSINEIGSLTVDGYIAFLVTIHTAASSRVELYEPHTAEVGAVGHPQPSRVRIEEETGVNGILILQTIRRTNLNWRGKVEVG